MEKKIEKLDVDIWSGQADINVRIEEKINQIIDYLNSQAQPEEEAQRVGCEYSDYYKCPKCNDELLVTCLHPLELLCTRCREYVELEEIKDTPEEKTKTIPAKEYKRFPKNIPNWSDERVEKQDTPEGLTDEKKAIDNGVDKAGTKETPVEPISEKMYPTGEETPTNGEKEKYMACILIAYLQAKTSKDRSERWKELRNFVFEEIEKAKEEGKKEANKHLPEMKSFGKEYGKDSNCDYNYVNGWNDCLKEIKQLTKKEFLSKKITKKKVNEELFDWACSELEILEDNEKKQALRAVISQTNKEGKRIGEKELSDELFTFFLWFRWNGEKYMDKSIEEMIGIYIQERKLGDVLEKTEE